MDDSLKNKIDDYWLNRLSSEERGDLERQMEKEPLFKQEVMAQQEIIRGINAYGEQQIKARLQSIHQEVVSPPVRSRRINIRQWAAAAAILLLCVCTVIFFLKPFAGESNTNQQLFASNYQAYDFSTGQRGGADEALLLALQDAYRQGDYKGVLNNIDQIAGHEEAPLALVEGIAQLESDNMIAAEEVFQRVIQQNNPLYVDHARWYLALTYLKQDKANQAKVSLQALVDNSSSDHHEEAKKLYDQLP